MRCSFTLWQFAKRAQITFGAVAKGNRSPFKSLCMQNPLIACNANHVSNIPLEEVNSEKNKLEVSLNSVYHPRFLYLWRLIQLYHFQANLIWCDGTFKDPHGYQKEIFSNPSVKTSVKYCIVMYKTLRVSFGNILQTFHIISLQYTVH